MAGSLIKIIKLTHLIALILMTGAAQPIHATSTWRTLFAGACHTAQYALAAGIPSVCLAQQIAGQKKFIKDEQQKHKNASLDPVASEYETLALKELPLTKLPQPLQDRIADGSLILRPSINFSASTSPDGLQGILYYNEKSVGKIARMRTQLESLYDENDFTLWLNKAHHPLYHKARAFLGLPVHVGTEPLYDTKSLEEEIKKQENEIAFSILHEAGHIVNNDVTNIKYQTIFCAHLLYMAPKLFTRKQVVTNSSNLHFILSNFRRIPLGGCQLALTTAVSLALQHYAEYRADLFAAHTSQDPAIIRAGALRFTRRHQNMLGFYHNWPHAPENANQELTEDGQLRQKFYTLFIKDKPNPTLAKRLLFLHADPEHPYYLDRASYLETIAQEHE